MVVETLPTRIIKYPDPRLRRKSAPIEVFDDSVVTLAERMIELMHADRGVGLAGPQVGVNRRIFTCNPTGEPADDLVLINPELVDLVGSVEADEGCLSVPDAVVQIRRARKCRIRAFDVHGQPLEIEGEDLLARIWQHELDHLDGRLIIDRMNDTDRLANKKTLAELEANYRSKAVKR
ncbi:MAG TPA: peptide deformylase [Phycisphaerae bacterium]|nr:peptide deformylase [Phycisphaerae bacterium]